MEDRRSSRFRVPLGAVSLEVDRAVDAKGHSVANLLDRLRWAQCEHDRLAAVRLDQPDRLLDPTFLMRADRETEMAGFQGHRVRGEHHLPAGERHALDADQDSHDLVRRLSGTQRRVEPAAATVTGPRSPPSCTARLVPWTA